MKRNSILTFLVGVALAACAGVAARDDALLPLVRQIWPDVKVEVALGIGTAYAMQEIDKATADSLTNASDALDLALKIGDHKLPRDIFVQLEPMALRGIKALLDSEAIGEGVAGSFRERLNNFKDSLAKLAER